VGYTEEEYFFTGQARSFRACGEFGRRDGKWLVETVSAQPYRTRLLVQRPRDPQRFNGTVLVEWINVSPGRDLLLVPDDALHEGFAYVGVSAQYVGIHGFDSEQPADREGLKQWDPERYGSLSHPGDAFCYDIFSQAGRLLRQPANGPHPLAGLDVRKLVATGGSQSAQRLRTYVNALQGQHHAYDAFVLFLDFGNCNDFSDAIFEPHNRTPEYRARVFRYPVRVRDDLDVPVMVVNSEKEAIRYRDGDRAFLLQPDTERFRHWEVAGAPHSADLPARRLPHVLTTQRDGLRGPRNRWPAESLSLRPGSHVSVWPCTVAAFHHVHNWINGGPLPPRQPRLMFTEGSSPRLLRDALGIGRGGVRLPETEVPIEVNTGLNDEPGLAEHRGLSVPFSDEQLKQLYPTREDYVRKVTTAAQAAVRAGVIRSYRAREYIAEANAAVLPLG
jgi:hypothetical protein